MLRQRTEQCPHNGKFAHLVAATAVGLVDCLVVELFVALLTHVDDEKKAVHRQRVKHVLEHLLLVDQRYPRVLEGKHVCRVRAARI